MSDNIYHKLGEYLGSFKYDPLAFVYACFPWGEGSLTNYDGPDEWQKKYLSELRDSLISKKDQEDRIIRRAVTSGHGTGKALPLSTIIDTPDGKKVWKDIAIGSRLFGRNGRPTTVVGVYPQGERPVYKITFDDKSVAYTDEDHLWEVTSFRNNHADYRKKEVVSTKQMLLSGVHRKNGVYNRRIFQLPTHEPVEYPEASLPIDPYVLGVWLGDGTRNKCCITSNDIEIINQIISRNYHLKRIEEKPRTTCKNYFFNGLRSSLIDLGLAYKYSYEKSIPDLYKYTSIQQRLDLLRGLMDTDGSVSHDGMCDFASSSEQLVHDVLWLVRSLGGKGRQSKTKIPFYRNKNGEKIICRPSYKITFCLSVCPFYLERKIARWHCPKEDRYLTRWVDSIEFSHYEETKCVTVDAEDHLFLMNDFIVTHNSALVAWLILWAMSTKPNTRCVVTSNTENQLINKTFSELSKWNQLFIGKELFTQTATALYSAERDLEKTWRCDATPWSSQRSEAFAGLHNQGVRILLVMDEASAIDDIIWEVAEGALTDKNTEIIWAVFGNPTRPGGKFYDCFHDQKHRWETQKVDSREVKISNKDLIESWIQDYGLDSDFVRVRVRGEFPRSGSDQFIPTDEVEKAVARWRSIHKREYGFLQPVLGVDPARFGDDKSVVVVRQGDYIHPPYSYNGIDTMELCAKILDIRRDYGGGGLICVDGVGIGAGVVDFLRHRDLPVIEVQSSGGAFDHKTYANKRAELYGKLKDWIVRGGCIPDQKDIQEQLTCFSYGYNNKLQLQIQSKKDIRKTLGKSPDVADALAYTMAYEEYRMLTMNTAPRRVITTRWA